MSVSWNMKDEVQNLVWERGKILWSHRHDDDVVCHGSTNFCKRRVYCISSYFSGKSKWRSSRAGALLSKHASTSISLSSNSFNYTITYRRLASGGLKCTRNWSLPNSCIALQREIRFSFDLNSKKAEIKY